MGEGKEQPTNWLSWPLPDPPRSTHLEPASLPALLGCSRLSGLLGCSTGAPPGQEAAWSRLASREAVFKGWAWSQKMLQLAHAL